MKMKDIAKKIGAEWQSMTETQKEPYEIRAKQRKQKYLADLEEYKKSDNYKKFQDTLVQVCVLSF